MPNVCGDTEEERRIAFVGISRAMKLLFLSHATTRMGRTAKRSLFLDEILMTHKKSLYELLLKFFFYCADK